MAKEAEALQLGPLEQQLQFVVESLCNRLREGEAYPFLVQLSVHESKTLAYHVEISTVQQQLAAALKELRGVKMQEEAHLARRICRLKADFNDMVSELEQSFLLQVHPCMPHLWCLLHKVITIRKRWRQARASKQELLAKIERERQESSVALRLKAASLIAGFEAMRIKDSPVPETAEPPGMRSRDEELEQHNNAVCGALASPGSCPAELAADAGQQNSAAASLANGSYILPQTFGSPPSQPQTARQTGEQGLVGERIFVYSFPRGSTVPAHTGAFWT